MQIETDRLIIPDTEYECTIQMSSKEFKTLCNDFHSIGDSIQISGNKECVRFALTGDIGSGELIYTHNDSDDTVMFFVLFFFRRFIGQNQRKN